MSDFPAARFHKQIIGSGSAESIGLAARLLTTSATPSSTAWPANNTGLFVPFTIAAPYLVRKLWWANGASVSGNTDCGVYTVGGTLLASAAPTAQSGTSVVQSVTLGTPLLLTPGSYYMALSSSTTSATYFMWNPGLSRLWVPCGVAEQSSVGTLPATFALGSMGRNVVPIFGIASSGVI